MNKNEAWEKFKSAKLGAGRTETHLNNIWDTVSKLFQHFKDVQQLEDFKADEIERWLLELDVEASSKSTYRKRLNLFFNWCKRKRLIPENPIERVETITVGMSERAAFTPVDLERVVREADAQSRELGSGVRYMLQGFRPRDFALLKPENVKLGDKIMHVYRSKLKRWMDMEIVSYAPLGWLGIASMPPRRYTGAENGKAAENVEREFASAFKEVCLEARIQKELSIVYTLRHTAATMLAAKWRDPFRMLPQMGWINIRQAERYVHAAQRTEWAKIFKPVDRVGALEQKVDRILGLLEGARIVQKGHEEKGVRP